jgi:hypothetical protein
MFSGHQLIAPIQEFNPKKETYGGIFFVPKISKKNPSLL